MDAGTADVRTGAGAGAGATRGFASSAGAWRSPVLDPAAAVLCVLGLLGVPAGAVPVLTTLPSSPRLPIGGMAAWAPTNWGLAALPVAPAPPPAPVAVAGAGAGADAAPPAAATGVMGGATWVPVPSLNATSCITKSNA